MIKDYGHVIDPEVNGWSIIIPTKRASRNLAVFLDALEKNSHFKHELIILTDIFTSWQTYQLLQERKLWYYQVENCNYYKNLNEGAKLATRDYLVFVQDDTVLSYNWDLNVSMKINNTMMVTPWMILPWQVHNMFGMTEHPSGQVEDFKLELWNDWCLKNLKNDWSLNLKVAHPIIMNKELFFKARGFCIHTAIERQHIHHEYGLECRVREICNGTIQGTNCAYSLHIPGSGWDGGWNYGYVPNQGRQAENIEYVRDSHYPVKCSECGFEKAGHLLSAEEGIRAETKATWLCPGCKKDTYIVTL